MWTERKTAISILIGAADEKPIRSGSSGGSVYFLTLLSIRKVAEARHEVTRQGSLRHGNQGQAS